ncbi:MAG: hypothetical protein ACN6O6_18870 [Pseudomonas sp.]
MTARTWLLAAAVLGTAVLLGAIALAWRHGGLAVLQLGMGAC